MSLTSNIERTKPMLKRFIRSVKLPIRKTPIRVAFSLLKYPNGNTAVAVYKPTLLGYKDWDILTVNTGTVLPENCVCIDTNHHGEEIINCLEQLRLGTSTGLNCASGFCKYPVFQFNLEKLQQYSIPNNARIHD